LADKTPLTCKLHQSVLGNSNKSICAMISASFHYNP
jgi:hypothetical protein